MPVSPPPTQAAQAVQAEADYKFPQVVAVGFKTRLVPAMMPDAARLSPPANYKDALKIAAWREEQAVKMAEQVGSQAFTATLDSVMICTSKKSNAWEYRDPAGPRGPRLAAPLPIWHWLKSHFPEAWPHSRNPRWPAGPPVSLIGFDIGTFVEIMKIECSAEQLKHPDGSPRLDIQTALPMSFWYRRNHAYISDHIDLESCFMPSSTKYVDWSMVLKRYGLSEMYKSWKGPHHDVSMDAALTMNLADRLGLWTRG